MPCGIMNESSFGLDNKRLAKGKSYMYAMWPKQWKLVLPLLRREENTTGVSRVLQNSER